MNDSVLSGSEKGIRPGWASEGRPPAARILSRPSATDGKLALDSVQRLVGEMKAKCALPVWRIALADKHARDMSAADGLGSQGKVAPGKVQVLCLKMLHQFAVAFVTCGSNGFQPCREAGRRLSMEEVTQEMQSEISPIEFGNGKPGAQLHPADQLDTVCGGKRQGGAEPIQGVMVGDGQRLEAGRMRFPKQLFRRRGPVGKCGVGMKVNHSLEKPAAAARRLSAKKFPE